MHLISMLGSWLESYYNCLSRYNTFDEHNWCLVTYLVTGIILFVISSYVYNEDSSGVIPIWNGIIGGVLGIAFVIFLPAILIIGFLWCLHIVISRISRKKQFRNSKTLTQEDQ